MAQKMHRTQIYLNDMQYNFLHQQAEKKHLSMAEVIRALIDNVLPQAKHYNDNPLFNLGKDKFAMKQKDGSTKHDKYIYKQEK